MRTYWLLLTRYSQSPSAQWKQAAFLIVNISVHRQSAGRQSGAIEHALLDETRLSDAEEVGPNLDNPNYFGAINQPTNLQTKPPTTQT